MALMRDPNKDFEPIRESLNGWRDDFPKNFYKFNGNLRGSLLHWLGKNRLETHEKLLYQVGYDAATSLNEWAIETNRDENLPQLRSYDRFGNRVEEVVFHPLYHEMGRKIYASKIMTLYQTPGLDVLQMAMFYLYAHNGEAGHCCPLACTAGAIKLIQGEANDQIKKQYLPRLLDPNYDTHLHASQFLTELQGGSDVGANKTRAIEAVDGTYRLYGEKWFCSVIDAGLFVVSARPEHAPEGTKGLTTFLVPRFLEDGRPNHFSIKRLKYKVGTRSMASAEIDLLGSTAHAVDAPGAGFKHILNYVLNTSRLYNSIAAAGAIQRAYFEASTYAKAREAFGQPILQYPLVRRSLAFLRTEAAVNLASSMHVASLAAKIADNNADDEDRQEFRFLVNANKYWTSIRATQAVREAIEVFGGNGAIEDFSVLPRLYRDSIVIESWEGSHNVLCQQILRDMTRYQVHASTLERAFQRVENNLYGDFALEARELLMALGHVRDRVQEFLRFEPQQAQLHIRPWIDQVIAVIQGCDLLDELATEHKAGFDTGKADILRYHILRTINNGNMFGSGEYYALEEKLAQHH